jgi:hypothetical protein
MNRTNPALIRASIVMAACTDTQPKTAPPPKQVAPVVTISMGGYGSLHYTNKRKRESSRKGRFGR